MNELGGWLGQWLVRKIENKNSLRTTWSSTKGLSIESYCFNITMDKWIRAMFHDTDIA